MLQDSGSQSTDLVMDVHLGAGHTSEDNQYHRRAGEADDPCSKGSFRAAFAYLHHMLEARSNFGSKTSMLAFFRYCHTAPAYIVLASSA